MSVVWYLLDTFDSFFSRYNFNYLFWYLNDNYLPSTISHNVSSAVYTLQSVLDLIFSSLVSLNNLLFNIISASDIILSFGLSTSMVNALFISIKFLSCIALLIFARGGIPRFRFDYLTKLGWIRFLSLVILSFLLEILLLSMI